MSRTRHDRMWPSDWVSPEDGGALLAPSVEPVAYTPGRVVAFDQRFDQTQTKSVNMLSGNACEEIVESDRHGQHTHRSRNEEEFG